MEVLIVLVYLFLPHGCTEVQNIAVGKLAWQSSPGAGVASRAVDGNTNQNLLKGHSCSHTKPGTTGHYWAVDLQRVYGSITKVKVYNRLECCSDRLKDITLLLGVTQANYVQRGHHPGAIGATYTFEFPATRGRFVKLEKMENDTTPLTMCEVEVFDSSVFVEEYKSVPLSIGLGTSLLSLKVDSNVKCAVTCVQHVNCNGFQIRHDGFDKVCELLSSSETTSDPSGLTVFIPTQ